MPNDAPIRAAVFVAVGENNLRAFSTDGLKWTHQQVGWDRILLWQVGFVGGRCAAVGKYWNDHVCMSTPDGVQWDRHAFEVQPAGTRLEAIGVVKDAFLGVRRRDGESPHLIRSADGKKWSAPQAIALERHAIRHDAFVRRFAHGKGLTVAVGDYGMRLVSSDLTTWKPVANASPKDTLIDVVYGNGVFVGGGMHGLRMRSVDGLTWTHRVVGEEGEHLNSVLFDGERFVGVGQGATYFSKDGIAWERTPNHDAPTTAACGAGAFVGSVWPGKMLYSKDAIVWKEVQTLPHHVLGLAFGRLGA